MIFSFGFFGVRTEELVHMHMRRHDKAAPEPELGHLEQSLSCLCLPFLLLGPETQCYFLNVQHEYRELYLEYCPLPAGIELRRKKSLTAWTARTERNVYPGRPVRLFPSSLLTVAGIADTRFSHISRKESSSSVGSVKKHLESSSRGKRSG